MERPPSVAVLGPGAVGGALAVHLSLAGARVICVARPDTAAAIARDGISLELSGSELQARPEATEVLDEPVEVLLITVKAPDLADALSLVAQSHKVPRVVPLLNGLEHLDLLRRRFGDSVVAGSIGRLEVFRESPTRLVQTTPSPVVTVAAPVELPGLDVRVEPDERRLLWDKVARLAPLAAATAATQRPVGELRADPAWRARLADAVREACAVAAADGVALDPAAQWEIIDAMPAELTTSTARDVAAGRPSELDAITGAVVRAGRRLGVPTPALAALLEEACRAQSR